MNDIKNLSELINHIDLTKVLSQEIWSIKNKKKNEIKFRSKYNLIKFLLKSFYKSLFYSPLIKFFKENNDIFYIRTYSRPDVNDHSGYYENIEGTTLCVFSNKKIKFDLIKFINTFILVYKLRKSLNLVFRNIPIRFFDYNSLKIFVILFNCISDTQKVFQILLHHKKLVSFQQMIPTENMICQLANLNNINTFALEQGVGFYKDKGYYWEKYPVTTYLNTVCKNILCWGVYSKSLFQKYTNANIFIIGKAFLPKINKVEDGITFVFQNADCVSANKELTKLSKISENNGIPTSRWFKTKGDIIVKNRIGRDGPLCKVIVGCSSNLLLELGFLGLQVMVIKSSSLAKFLPEEIVLDEPNSVLRDNKVFEYPHKHWKKFIECTGKESVKKYRDLLIEN